MLRRTFGRRQSSLSTTSAFSAFSKSDTRSFSFTADASTTIANEKADYIRYELPSFYAFLSQHRFSNLRHFVLKASSGDGSGSGSGSGSGDNSSGKADADDGDDGERPEDWIVPRTCLFVLIMFGISVGLYLLSKPNGPHLGWSSVYKHIDDISSIAIYEHYAQLYTDNGPVHVGLINDQDTQKRLDTLSDLYTKNYVATHNERHTQSKKSKEGSPEAKGEDNKSEEAENKSEKPASLPVSILGTPTSESALAAFGIFMWIVPFIFFPVYATFLSQFIGKTMMYAADSGKAKVKATNMVFKLETNCPTRFRDVAGMKEPKKEITEIVDFLRHPERYTKLGAKIPTGALLLGPPGTGKTLLAKAIAGESGVGFISVAGSDFVELYVGRGAKRVRELFAEARKQRCIVYIDEIDAVGLKRQGSGQGEKQEQEQTLNELLVQMDGFKTRQRGDVMVLASSNVAQSALDPALIRPGRFDRVVHVDAPVISERIDIFKVHLSKLKLTTTPEEAEGATAESFQTDDKTEKKTTTTTTTTTTATNVKTDSTSPDAEKEEYNTNVQENEKVKAVEEEKIKEATAAATVEAKVETANVTETSVVTTSNEAESEKDKRVKEEEEQNGVLSFDFRSLLVHKSEVERALIDTYAVRMSNLCPGFVGADIANVCNEAAILAARERATHVDIHHLERSIDRVIAGIEQRSRVLSPFEKNVVAHHEAGHAVAGWFLNRADPLMKVSIVPRGGSALGYAQYLPNENYGRTAKEIRDSISVTLGGRVAEQIFFNHLSTGASDDLRKVGKMSYMYVASFYPGSVYPAPGSDSTRFVKPYGDSKSDAFDEKAKQLVDEVYASTYDLLLKHKDDMERLAQHLLKHELLTFQDVVHYLGARKERESDRKRGV